MLVHRWENINKDKPDVLKRTKYFKHKVRENGKWVMKECVKVYNQVEGEFDFEETQGRRVAKNEAVDTGAFELCEDQAQKHFEQTASAALGSTEFTSKAFLASEFETKLVSYANPSSSSAAPAEKKQKRDRPGDDGGDASSEDEMVSPLERMLGEPPKKKTKKADAEHTPKKSPSNAVNQSPESKLIPGHVQTVIDDAKDALAKFQNMTDLKDLSAESLNSVAGRLQTKKRALTKAMGKKVDPSIDESLNQVNFLRGGILAIVETIKAIEAADKKMKKDTANKRGRQVPSYVRVAFEE